MTIARTIPLLTSLPAGLIAMLVIGIPLAIVMIVLTRKALRLERDLQENGIVADAVVVRCESRRSDGRIRYSPYVRYVAGGKEHEAAINVACNFPIGRKVKIQYIPSKWNYVAFVSQDLSTP